MKKPNRVLHIGDLCRVAINNKRGMEDLGYKAKVLVYNTGYEAENNVYISPLRNVRGLKYVYNFFFVLFHGSYLYHCHGMAAIYPFLQRRKYVLHCHGSDLRELPSRKGILAKLFKSIIKNAKVVIVSTPDLVDEYLSQGFNAERIRYVPNPVQFAPEEPAFKKVNPKKIRLFCPSSNHPLKCKSNLINAYNKLYLKYGEGISLTLIDYADGKIDGLLFLFDQNALNTVKVIKKCSNAEILNQYDQHDIVLDQFCNIKAHGVITYEACAHKKPVVCTIGERLFPSSGIIPGASEDEIFTSISNVIDNDFFESIANKSYFWAKETVSCTAVAKSMREIYIEFFGFAR